MTKMLKGIAASDGIAAAKAYMLVHPDLSFSETSIDDPEAEIKRLDDAVEASKSELELIKQKATENLGEEEAQVFEAHLTILADPELLGQIKDKIKNDKVNAEAALKSVTDMFIEMFEAMTDNAYMQERAGDIRDVTKRIMSHLLGVTLPNPALIQEERQGPLDPTMEGSPQRFRHPIRRPPQQPESSMTPQPSYTVNLTDPFGLRTAAADRQQVELGH